MILLLSGSISISFSVNQCFYFRRTTDFDLEKSIIQFNTIHKSAGNVNLAFGGKLGDFGGWRAGAAKGRGPFDENRGKARPGTLFASALGLQTLLLCGAYEAAPLHAPVLRRGAGFLCAPEWALWRKAHSGGLLLPKGRKKEKAVAESGKTVKKV
jgi:hypothetical protein